MSQLSRRGALRLLGSLGAAGAAAPFLSACGSSNDDDTSTASKGTVKIGLLLPETGANKFIGDDMRQGFDLFLTLNGRRLGGYDVQLVAADEGETKESAKAAMEKLKQEKVLAVTGIASAQAMVEVRDIVEQAHIPLIGSNASPPQLSTLYIWRTSYVDTELGVALGEYVASQLGGGTAAMIASESIGRDAVQGFQQTLVSAGGRIESQATYVPAGAADFNSFLQPLRNSQTVKAIFAFFAGSQAEAFVKQYSAAFRDKNPKIPLFGPGFLTEGPLLKQQGDAARDVWTSFNYSPDLDNAANRRFAAEYQKKHQVSPTTYAMASYDAGAVLNQALGLVEGELSGESLNAAIGRVGQISSPRGEWQFNTNRSPQQRWYLRQVRWDGAVLSNNVVSELDTLG
ncbi:ABC transporter substrate-binding protein [Virgisporangium ochraceum]|uniref:ABC transporter substrate-binding protein n=1 Tax=Virgisporangium ochraceum TaxID=65505 RepID=A0A8J3ZPU5_9ACTN|nr:ABC transporter substrate-binding protein [Virgisporangium ochraceum]GIJ66060.1 ABC transporter substrate-binding protein [Virgisporangium ochraceum]